MNIKIHYRKTIDFLRFYTAMQEQASPPPPCYTLRTDQVS